MRACGMLVCLYVHMRRWGGGGCGCMLFCAYACVIAFMYACMLVCVHASMHVSGIRVCVCVPGFLHVCMYQIVCKQANK